MAPEQQQAREKLVARIHTRDCACDERSNDCPHWWEANEHVGAVLSADPRLVAEAMGGTVKTETRVPEGTIGGVCRVTYYDRREQRTVIVLPWEEVTGDE